MTAPPALARRRGPKPRGYDSTKVGIRLSPTELDALDRLIADEGQGDTRGGLARLILLNELEAQGFLGKPKAAGLPT